MKAVKILQLRNHSVEGNRIFDVLFADDENFNDEDNFISENTVLMGQYLGFFPNIEKLKKANIRLHLNEIKRIWKQFLTKLRKRRVMWEIEYRESRNNRQNSTSGGPAVNLRPHPDNSTSAGHVVANNNEYEWKPFNPSKGTPDWLKDNGPAVRAVNLQSARPAVSNNNTNLDPIPKGPPSWHIDNVQAVQDVNLQSARPVVANNGDNTHKNKYPSLYRAARQPTQAFEVLPTIQPNNQQTTESLLQILEALKN